MMKNRWNFSECQMNGAAGAIYAVRTNFIKYVEEILKKILAKFRKLYLKVLYF